MTDIPADLRPSSASSLAAPALDAGWVWPLCVALVLAVGFARTWPIFVDVWTTGVFNDTDDAMRMAQVRALLAGQGWFDMTVYRLSPPDGVVMHWSRIVDVPLALLIRFFAVVAAPGRAEILARIAFPLLCTMGYLLAVTRGARLLGGEAARLPALCLALFASAIAQFVPGRIDHHAPQIVLLVLFFGWLVGCFQSRRAVPAALAACAAALSLAISLENLPFIAVGAAGLALAWVAEGRELRMPLLGFAGGLGLALPAMFLATVGPAQWLAPACDSYSSAFLVVGLVGAAVLAALAAASECLAGRDARLVAAVAGGALVLGIFVLGFPACLHDPLGSSDPLIALWLRNIDEGRSLPALFAVDPRHAAAIVVPNALACLAALWIARGSAPRVRACWFLAAGLVAIGFAGACWQVRVDTSTSAITVVVGVAAAVQVARRFADPARRLSLLVWTLVFGLPFTNVAFAIAIDREEAAVEVKAAETRSCGHPADFAGLSSLPPSLLFNPIDTGPNILLATGHSIVAASYHRAVRGNRLVLEAFMADPDAAEAPVRASGARYLVFCPDIGEMKFDRRQAPNGLAAALFDDHPPDWLVPVHVPGPFKVFALRVPTVTRSP